VEKSFFLRAVIVFIFFLILLILTSEPVLLNKLPLPHSPARTHLLLSIGANCHRHTHKNTHTHTHIHTHTVFINYDIHVQWSIWRHGKSWVQLLADNSWVLRTWLWIHLISSNCFSCSHHSLTHSCTHQGHKFSLELGMALAKQLLTTNAGLPYFFHLCLLDSFLITLLVFGQPTFPSPHPPCLFFFSPWGFHNSDTRPNFFWVNFVM
jgi:hypothetical protein